MQTWRKLNEYKSLFYILILQKKEKHNNCISLYVGYMIIPDFNDVQTISMSEQV